MLVQSWTGYAIPISAIGEWVANADLIRMKLKEFMLFPDQELLAPGAIEVTTPLRVERPVCFWTIYLTGATHHNERMWLETQEFLCERAIACVRKCWPQGQNCVVIQVLIQTVHNEKGESATFEKEWCLGQA